MQKKGKDTTNSTPTKTEPQEVVLQPSQKFASKFKNEMKNLQQLYLKYQSESSDKTTIPTQDLALFFEWALYYCEYCDEDIHSGGFKPEIVTNNKNLSKSENKDQFMKNYFPGLFSNSWPIRFNSKFLSKLGGLKSENLQLYIIELIQKFSEGFLSGLNVVPVQGLSYMIFLKYKIPNQNLSLIVCIHLEQYPELDKYDKVKALHYKHVFRFLDIINESEKVTAQNTCLAFLDDCKNDPAKQEGQPKLSKKQNTNSTTFTDEKGNRHTVRNCPCFEKLETFHGEVIVRSEVWVQGLKEPENDQIITYLCIKPNLFEVNYLTPEEMEDLSYNKEIHRWVSKKAYTLFLRRKENAIVSKINSEVLEKFADFESSGKLVDLLEKMKNLKIKLTTEEKRLIGQSGNVLAIGRSGTGKTTCCVLRLFSQDMLYKLRLAQAQVKHGVLRDARHMADQLDNLIGIHSIFVTASPVLTNEVSRYYQNLSKRIKNEIKKREEIKKQSSESPEKNEEQKISEIVTEKNFEETIQMDKDETKEEEVEEEIFNEEDYLMDDEEAEIMAKLNKNYSLDAIDDKEFPLFLTIKRLVLMIDGTLQHPFFERKSDHSIIGSDTRAQWHNELKGLMMISNKYRDQQGEENDEVNLGGPYNNPNEGLIKEEEEEKEEEDQEEYGGLKIDDSDIEKEYERYQAILRKKKEQSEKESELRKKNKMSFEVDYDYFFNHFWNGHLSRQDRPSNISPIIVWSEIISTIKGSAESHLSPGFYLSQEVYISLQKEGSTFLNNANREKVYKLFIEYEQWKIKEGGYDFMDVTNHGLNEIRLRGYGGVPIHFVMIDEVQDLSHATLLLLMKITEQNVFFAGDTAQTIAKGVGVRFSDLSNLFKLSTEKEQAWKRPIVHQLTVNFRSHGKILDIANSVVTLMETYFPKTIDKLKKEKSEVDGPKPILLEDVDIEVLFAVLFGTENFKSHRHSQNQSSALEKPPIEFGCNQAIIVRDQESKNKLPPLLKHALCLTVYEAKGLEFDDVILYNFFSESPLTAKEWELLGLLEIENKKIDKDTFERYYFTYKEEGLSDLKTESSEELNTGRKDDQNEELDLQAPNLFNAELDKSADEYVIKKVNLQKKYYTVYDHFENYGMVCNEFKQLYVALTRPRNRIVIYDDNIEKRVSIENYWKQLSLVQVINKSTLEEQNISSTDKDLESFKSLLASTSQDEWKMQGLKMFRNKYYEQAVKCFEKAQDERLKNRAEAYMLAERASNRFRTIKNEQNSILRDQTKLKENESKERRTRAKQLKKEEKICIEEYEKAANIFFELELLKQAAQCYFSAELYQNALEIYEKIGLFREAGEAGFMLKQYERAAGLFMKGGDFIRAFECFEMTGEYDRILEILENWNDLPQQQRKYYAQKYVPLALKNLTEQIDYKSPLHVEKNKEITEEDSEEEEDNSIIGKENTNKVAEQQIEEVKIDDQKQSLPKKEISEVSFDVIEDQSQDKNTSTSIIDVHKFDSKQTSELSFEHVDNYEHLSQYDLQDEFLKSESGSIIDSINSQRKDKSAVSSDFSAIDYNYIMDNHYHLVKTRADIFIQDSVMEKIIKYVNMFSDEFKETLQHLRSKDVLLTETANSLHKNSSTETITNNLVDLDHISLDFVYFALDFLEQSKLFKLCIFVCNRYNLANKLGRYLVDIALKYSTFPNEDMRANFFKLFLPRNRQIQQEKAFVANTALHNVLEIITPKYIQLKKKGEHCNETNSLGDDCFSSLISLGFWKKCLFLMDYKNSLALASAFANFNNYKVIYLTGSNDYNLSKEEVQKMLDKEGFDFLPFQLPVSEDEMNAAIIGLESVTWDLAEKFPMHLYKHYKPEARSSSQIIVPTFPSYFSYNGVLWNFLINKEKEKFGEHIIKATQELNQILRNNENAKRTVELKLFDIITFLIQVAIFYNSNHIVSEFINKMDAKDVSEYIISLRKIIEHILITPNFNKFEETILRAILSPFRVRFIERTSVLKRIGLHNFLIHISSPVIPELISNERSAEAPLIYDIEGNFVLSKTSICTQVIRSKILDAMKSIIVHQIRQIRCFQNINEAGLNNINAKVYLEAQGLLIGEIICFSDCSGNASKLGEKKKKGLKSDKKGNQEIHRVEQEEFDDRDEFNYEDMIGNYKEGKVTIKSKLNKTQFTQKPQTVKAPTQQNNENLIEKTWTDIWQDIKDVLRGFVDFTIELNCYAREELLKIGLLKINKYIQQKKVKPWIVNFFYLIGCHGILTEILRKNKMSFTAEKLQQYNDAVYYRRFYCSEEYTSSMFEFISACIKKLKASDLIPLLEDLSTYALIADSISTNFNQVKLQASLTSNLGIDLNSSEKQTLVLDITPLYEGAAIAEIFHWISKITDRIIKEGQPSLIGQQLIKIIINLLSNITIIDDESLNLLEETINLLLDTYEFIASDEAKPQRKNSKSENSKDNDVFLENLINNLKDLGLEDKLDYFVKLYKKMDAVVIAIQSDSKIADKNVEKCEKAYLLDQKTIAIRISIQRRIRRLYLKKRKDLRIKERLIINSSKTNYPLELINAALSLNKANLNELQRFLVNLGLKIDTFNSIDTCFHTLLNYYAVNVVDNPIDFHYISSLLTKIVNEGLEYVNILKQGLMNRETLKKNDIKEDLKEKMKNIDNIMQEYHSWRQKQQSKSDDKVAKRQKLSRAKWEEEALMIKMQEIAKKRKGLRKQNLQMMQKLKIKLFGKK